MKVDKKNYTGASFIANENQCAICSRNFIISLKIIILNGTISFYCKELKKTTFNSSSLVFLSMDRFYDHDISSYL